MLAMAFADRAGVGSSPVVVAMSAVEVARSVVGEMVVVGLSVVVASVVVVSLESLLKPSGSSLLTRTRSDHRHPNTTSRQMSSRESLKSQEQWLTALNTSMPDLSHSTVVSRLIRSDRGVDRNSNLSYFG